MAPLVAGLISLVVLVGVYFAVTSYNARKQAEADAESNAANAKIMLAEYKSADVRNIEYSYNGSRTRTIIGMTPTTTCFRWIRSSR